MIPEAIRTAFRCWTRHPWMAFWGITLIVVPLVMKLLSRLRAFSLPDDLSLLGTKICVWAGIALWLGSFIYAVLVTWKRSKVGAVNAVVLFGIGVVLTLPQTASMRRRGPDDWVKYSIRNAATAQEAYFVDHDTYTTNIGSLPGYNQSHNVTMSASATKTTFVITGTATKRCKPDTGTWSINGTTGEITGTRCR